MDIGNGFEIITKIHKANMSSDRLMVKIGLKL